MSFFKNFYRIILVPDLINKFNYTNLESLPKIQKITVNIGWKTPELRNLLLSLLALELITSQKAVITFTKNSKLSIKVKKGLPSGCKVTLRANLIYQFVYRLVNEIFPRLNSFKGLKFKNPSLKANATQTLTFSVLETLTFPELEKNYHLFKNIGKLDITVSIKAKHYNELFFILKSLKLPLISYF
jgi:large subunit ribosomal protein L5